MLHAPQLPQCNVHCVARESSRWLKVTLIRAGILHRLSCILLPLLLMVVWLLNKKMKPCDLFFLFFFFFIRVTQTCWVFFFFSHCRFSKMTPLPGESGLFQKALLNTCTFSKCSTGNKGRIQTEMRVRNNLRTSGTPGG